MLSKAAIWEIQRDTHAASLIASQCATSCLVTPEHAEPPQVKTFNVPAKVAGFVAPQAHVNEDISQ